MSSTHAYKDHKILTVPEVAKYLKFSEATIYRMAQRGKIPAFRIGRAWRFHKDMIEEWLAEHYTGPKIE